MNKLCPSNGHSWGFPRTILEFRLSHVQRRISGTKRNCIFPEVFSTIRAVNVFAALYKTPRFEGTECDGQTYF